MVGLVPYTDGVDQHLGFRVTAVSRVVDLDDLVRQVEDGLVVQYLDVAVHPLVDLVVHEPVHQLALRRDLLHATVEATPQRAALQEHEVEVRLLPDRARAGELLRDGHLVGVVPDDVHVLVEGHVEALGVVLVVEQDKLGGGPAGRGQLHARQGIRETPGRELALGSSVLSFFLVNDEHLELVRGLRPEPQDRHDVFSVLGLGVRRAVAARVRVRVLDEYAGGAVQRNSDLGDEGITWEQRCRGVHDRGHSIGRGGRDRSGRLRCGSGRWDGFGGGLTARNGSQGQRH